MTLLLTLFFSILGQIGAELTYNESAMKMKNYEIDAIVGKVVRMINEKKEVEWENEVKKDKGLKVLRRDMGVFIEECEEMEKKRVKLNERVVKLGVKYGERGNVMWNSGYGMEVNEVGVSRKIDYTLEQSVRESVVIWNMDGKKVEEMIEELVERLG